ncbi:MAG: thioredoxin [Chloroflexota bacterium]
MAQGILNSLFGKKGDAGAGDGAQQAGEALLVHVTDADFETQVLQADRPVLVDFWAEWCTPCRMIGPIVAELAHEYAGKITVAKMDTDNNPQTPGRYGIMGIPTLILFQDGQEVQRVVGVRPKHALAQMLDATLEKS